MTRTILETAIDQIIDKPPISVGVNAVRKVSINDSESAVDEASRKGKKLNEYIKEKAEKFGFSPLLH